MSTSVGMSIFFNLLWNIQLTNKTNGTTQKKINKSYFSSLPKKKLFPLKTDFNHNAINVCDML